MRGSMDLRDTTATSVLQAGSGDCEQGPRPDGLRVCGKVCHREGATWQAVRRRDGSSGKDEGKDISRNLRAMA